MASKCHPCSPRPGLVRQGSCMAETMVLPREKRLQSLEQKVQETLKKPPPDPPPQLQKGSHGTYLLSTDETLNANAQYEAKLRTNRILQVRAQEMLFASQEVEDFRDRKCKDKQKLLNHLKEVWKADQQKRIASLEEEFVASCKNMGLSHDAAVMMQRNRAVKEELQLRQAAESRCWDVLRFEEALHKVRACREERESITKAADARRKQADIVAKNARSNNRLLLSIEKSKQPEMPGLYQGRNVSNINKNYCVLRDRTNRPSSAVCFQPRHGDAESWQAGDSQRDCMTSSRARHAEICHIHNKQKVQNEQHQNAQTFKTREQFEVLPYQHPYLARCDTPSYVRLRMTRPASCPGLPYRSLTCSKVKLLERPVPKPRLQKCTPCQTPDSSRGCSTVERLCKNMARKMRSTTPSRSLNCEEGGYTVSCAGTSKVGDLRQQDMFLMKHKKLSTPNETKLDERRTYPKVSTKLPLGRYLFGKKELITDEVIAKEFGNNFVAEVDAAAGRLPYPITSTVKFAKKVSPQDVQSYVSSSSKSAPTSPLRLVRREIKPPELSHSTSPVNEFHMRLKLPLMESPLNLQKQQQLEPNRYKVNGQSQVLDCLAAEKEDVGLEASSRGIQYMERISKIDDEKGCLSQQGIPSKKSRSSASSKCLLSPETESRDSSSQCKKLWRKGVMVERPHTVGPRPFSESKKRKAKSPQIPSCYVGSKKAIPSRPLTSAHNSRGSILIEMSEKSAADDERISIIESVKGNIRENVYRFQRSDPPTLTREGPRTFDVNGSSGGDPNRKGRITNCSLPRPFTAQAQQDAVTIIYGAQRRAQPRYSWKETVMRWEDKGALLLPRGSSSSSSPNARGAMSSAGSETTSPRPKKQLPNVSSNFQPIDERFIMLLSTTTVESLKAVGAVAAFAAMDANCDGLSTDVPKVLLLLASQQQERPSPEYVQCAKGSDYRIWKARAMRRIDMLDKDEKRLEIPTRVARKKATWKKHDLLVLKRRPTSIQKNPDDKGTLTSFSTQIRAFMLAPSSLPQRGRSFSFSHSKSVVSNEDSHRCDHREKTTKAQLWNSFDNSPGGSVRSLPIHSGLGPLNIHARRIATQNCERRRAAEHSALCSGSGLPLHSPPLNIHQASAGTSQGLMEVGELTARNVADKLIDAWVTGKFGGDFYKAIRKAAKITGQPLNSMEDQNRYPERPYLRPWLSQSGTSLETPREDALQQATLLIQKRSPPSRNICKASRPCSEKSFKMAPKADAWKGVCRENRTANPQESQMMECAEASLSDRVKEKELASIGSPSPPLPSTQGIPAKARTSCWDSMHSLPSFVNSPERLHETSLQGNGERPGELLQRPSSSGSVARTSSCELKPPSPLKYFVDDSEAFMAGINSEKSPFRNRYSSPFATSAFNLSMLRQKQESGDPDVPREIFTDNTLPKIGVQEAPGGFKNLPNERLFLLHHTDIINHEETEDLDKKGLHVGNKIFYPFGKKHFTSPSLLKAPMGQKGGTGSNRSDYINLLKCLPLGQEQSPVSLECPPSRVAEEFEEQSNLHPSLHISPWDTGSPYDDLSDHQLMRSPSNFSTPSQLEVGLTSGSPRDSNSSRGVLQPGCHHQMDFEYVRCGDKLKRKYKSHSKRRGVYHKKQHRSSSPKQRPPFNPSGCFSPSPSSARISTSLPVTRRKVQIHAQRCFALPREGTRGSDGPAAISGRISGCRERSPPALTCHSGERHDAKVEGSRVSTESPTWREVTRSPEVLDLAAKLLYGEIILPAPRAKQVVDKHRQEILDRREKGHQFDLETRSKVRASSARRERTEKMKSSSSGKE